MTNQQLLSDFIAEINEVQNTLLAATADLISPLGDLVRAQVRHSQPPICAAVVLAVARPPVRRAGTSPAEDGLRHKRIVLAAALEMLHIALNVHRLLVNAALREQQSPGEMSLDASFIGSTILAGDYCFSRAAQMAAQTEHARVVAVFALALQTVSEGLLREQFAQDYAGDGNYGDGNYGDGNYDETRQLLHSGAHAAALLVDLPENRQQQAVALSQELATHWAIDKRQTLSHQALTHQGEPLPEGWQTLLQWLYQQRANGEMSATPPTRLP
ncbi:MAG: hypothetical protein IT328_03955 [Caldilineaceae bacterium]|nr:hypothetical protein [Caldilineaceae bacterium]